MFHLHSLVPAGHTIKEKAKEMQEARAIPVAYQTLSPEEKEQLVLSWIAPQRKCPQRVEYNEIQKDFPAVLMSPPLPLDRLAGYFTRGGFQMVMSKIKMIRYH